MASFIIGFCIGGICIFQLVDQMNYLIYHGEQKTIIPGLDSIKMDTVQSLLDNFAESHVYINESDALRTGTLKYMCTEYSTDLVRELRMLGIQSYIWRGCDAEGCHAWVRIMADIEPQTGEWVLNYGQIYPENNEIYS